MLNLFPIQWLSLFAYFILRTATALVLFFFAWQHYQARHELAQVFTFSFFPFGKIAVWSLILTEIIIGLSLLFGFFTQVGALLLIVYSVKLFFLNKKWHHPSLPSRPLCLILAALGFSLFITGAGVFAFDLPI